MFLLRFRFLLSWLGIQLMTTTFLNLPPHLLNSAALWYPQWTKYLLTSSTPPLSGTPSGQNTFSPPPLRRSLVPPVDKIPPHLLNSAAFWYPQWTKYLLTSSPPPLSGTPSGQNTSSPPQLRRSLVPPVDKIPSHLLPSAALWYPQWTKYLLTSSALWRPKWTKYLLPSSTSPLSGAPSGPHPALGRPKWTKYLLPSSTSPLSGTPSGPQPAL